MANDNIQIPVAPVEEDINLVDPLQSEVQELGPSTMVNQAETAKAQDHENKLNEIKKKSKQRFGKEFTTQEAQEQLLQDIQTAEQKQEIIQKEESEKALVENKKKEADIKKYMALKKEYKDRGILFKENPEMEQSIKSKEEEIDLADSLKIDEEPLVDEKGEVVETPEGFKEATQPEVSEVNKVAQGIKEKNTRIQAEQLAANEEIAKQKEIVNKAQAKISEQDKELANIDPNRWWNSKSTWQKILAGIGMALGGIPASKAVQNAIANDIEAQKLDKQNSLAKKEHSLKLVNMHIDKLTALTNDKHKQQQLQLQKQQLQLEQDKTRNERLEELNKNYQKQLLGQKLASSEGVDRNEFFNLDKELKKTGIQFADGKFRFASSSEAAKKTREVMENNNSALKGLAELKEIGDEFLGGALPLTEAKAKADLIVQSTIGKLRLELFGPGVLTDTEQKIARSIIGNPAKFFSLKRLEIAKLNSLMNKLRYSTRQSVRINGIKLPPSENDKNIAKIIKAKASEKGWDINKVIKNKSVYKSLKNQAMKTLNANNEWVEETEF